MKAFFALVALSALVSSCSLLGPKPHVVYERPDIKNEVEKLIVFPVTDFKGKRSEGSNKLDTQVAAAWSDLYGKEKVIPGGSVLYKLIQKTGKDSYLKIIKSLDNVSAVEQLTKSPQVRKLVSKVTDKFGNFHFAFAIRNGGSDHFDDGKPVRLHIGLFDSTNMTWKWITKVQEKKGLLSFGGYDSAAVQMVSNSFGVIEELHEKSHKSDSKE